MVETIQANQINLEQLENTFGLQLTSNEDFFREWQDDLPAITELEIQRLDRVKASYTNLIKHPPLLENSVKMVMLSPLLDLAGFYLPPFHIKSEHDERLLAEHFRQSILQLSNRHLPKRFFPYIYHLFLSLSPFPFLLSPFP